MTWEYLAGLFDGEGSISYGGHKRQQLQVTLSQMKQNWVLIDAMEEFLIEENIGYSISINKKPDGRLGKVITVSAVDDAERMLSSLKPYLILKKDRAIAGLIHLDEKKVSMERRKNFCKFNHALVESNIYFHDGKRYCRECRRRRSREAYHAAKAK